MPIQGSEADIMKLVMRDLYNLIQKEYQKDSYILLQIHDEIVFEVKENVVEEFSKKAKDIMLNTVVLEVPFDVHISTGKSFAEL